MKETFIRRIAGLNRITIPWEVRASLTLQVGDMIRVTVEKLEESK